MLVRKSGNTRIELRISAMLLLFLLITNSIIPQEFRINLPSQIYNAPYKDNSLNIYDFGNNPAWLIKDETNAWLKISPQFVNTSGEYRRKYDYAQSNFYGIKFTKLKPLNDGTFLGYASYNFEDRRDVYRSLKYDTYAGEAFFSTDTNSGDFNYKGPSVGFTYSFELLPGLFAGPSAKYRIMDGLKKVYSRAKTLYREAGADIGIAYLFSENLIIGTTIGLNDVQEKIESSSDDLSQVEIFNFKGETYSVIDRQEVVSQKIRKQAWKLGAQVFISQNNIWELGAKANYGMNGTKIIIPRSNLNYEDGYADQKDLNLSLRGRYYYSNNLLLGLFCEYIENKSWSKNSLRNLLLWEWKIDELKLGSGFTYYFREAHLSVSGEFEFSQTEADSNKFIDHRESSLVSDNYIVKFAAEYELFPGSYISAGFNRGFYNTDLIAGGKDLLINSVNLGFSKTWNKLQVDLTLLHNYRSPSTGTTRESLMTLLELKYFNL